MTFPDFRPSPNAGHGRCSVTEGDPEHPTRCQAPVKWHIAWGHVQGNRQTSYACDPHMSVIQAEYVYADRHPHGPACGDTSWETCAAESQWQAPDGEQRRSLLVSTERATAAVEALRQRLAFDLHPDLQGPDEEPTT